MADKTITFSKSIVAQKDISEEGITAYITQLSKPIILKGISTKTCPNVLYSIDGVNFTKETSIPDSNVLSMAIVPFQLGGATIDSPTSSNITKSILTKAFSYILGGRNVNEDINIQSPISKVTSDYSSANGAYRYLLQYLADNTDKIEWDTGDLFLSLNPGIQDLFGGSDFITDYIPVTRGDTHELSIAKQSDANGSILKPSIKVNIPSNYIIIKQSAYFFLYPEACPDSGSSDKLIIDNFWRGGGLLVSGSNNYRHIFMLYIFAVA
jgi:hypothetical protein